MQSLNYSGGPNKDFREKEMKLVMHIRQTQNGTQMLHKKPLRRPISKEIRRVVNMSNPKVIKG